MFASTATMANRLPEAQLPTAPVDRTRTAVILDHTQEIITPALKLPLKPQGAASCGTQHVQRSSRYTLVGSCQRQ